MGKHPGIFLTWPKARWLVDEYSSARHEAFKSLDVAKQYLQTQLALLPPLSPATHRVHYEYKDLDSEGHEVFECFCFSEFFCKNGKEIAIY